MKTIGLLGGMSWESTVSYYEIINQTIKEKLGGLHSGKILLYSVDFQEIEECQSKGEWDKSTEILGTAAKNLENAGADFLVICTNTMHKIASDIMKYIDIPLIHIAEATATQLLKNNIKKVALLGTKYTMEENFYKNKIIEKGIEVFIPDTNDIHEINRIIFEELCLGVTSDLSTKKLLNIIEEMIKDYNIEGVILGCTELGLSLKDGDCKIPFYDTALIHSKAAALMSLED
ncbi:aspartate/glutamate racemase family protein [Fusobacterium sp. PH5-44]|uniref:aspartate/glutamate racemase family protein n=1 Tax=unclassified Fusobacterium TaxID=2648384 RepID=UPI003D1D5901